MDTFIGLALIVIPFVIVLTFLFIENWRSALFAVFFTGLFFGSIAAGITILASAPK